jgi:hypothetical protein
MNLRDENIKSAFEDEYNSLSKRAYNALELVYTQLRKVSPVTEKGKKQLKIMFSILRAHGWIHSDSPLTDINSPASWPEMVDCADCGGSGRHPCSKLCKNYFYDIGLGCGEDATHCPYEANAPCPTCKGEKKVEKWYGKFVREECKEECPGPSVCKKIPLCAPDGYIYRQLTGIELWRDVEWGTYHNHLPSGYRECVTSLMFNGQPVIKREVER